MQTPNLARFAEEVGQAYPNATSTTESTKTYLRIARVTLPIGCSPTETAALVVLEPGQAPQLFIKALPKLSNGRDPRSCSATTIAGETWYTFSYTFKQAWDENRHTAVQFIEGRLRRFALNE
jgi:hypothetical protein